MKNNNIIIGLIVLFCLFSSKVKGQTSIVNMGEVNTNIQDIPQSVNQMPNGDIILATTHFQSYKAKQYLVMVKLTQDGKPYYTKEIVFKDTGIVSTGGIYDYNRGYILFASFASDTLYDKATSFGCLVLDSLFNVVSKVNYDAATEPSEFLFFPKIKQDTTTGEYYGMVTHFRNQTDLVYANLLIIDSNLTIQNNKADSNAIMAFEDSTFIVPQSVGGGDICKLNDSIYHLVYTDRSIVGHEFRQFNRNTNKVYQSFLEVILLDSSPYIHAAFLIGNEITCSKYTDTSVLISGVVKQDFYPDIFDSLLFQPFQLGQSLIVEMSLKTGFAIKYHLFEPWQYDTYETSSEVERYFPGLIQHTSMYNNDAVFYTRVLHGTSNEIVGNSIIKVTCLYKNLTEKWTASINKENDDKVENPYSIIATMDNGCLLFTAKMVRTYNDPAYGLSPEYDIAVYKINNMGVVTSTQNISKYIAHSTSKIVLYPNPANTEIQFDGLNSNTNYELTVYDVSGKVVLTKTIQSSVHINISVFTNGIYHYTISHKTEARRVGKFSVMH